MEGIFLKMTVMSEKLHDNDGKIISSSIYFRSRLSSCQTNFNLELETSAHHDIISDIFNYPNLGIHFALKPKFSHTTQQEPCSSRDSENGATKTQLIPVISMQDYLTIRPQMHYLHSFRLDFDLLTRNFNSFGSTHYQMGVRIIGCWGLSELRILRTRESI